MTQTVPVVPDYLGGIFARLKAYAPTVALVNNQISGALGEKWRDHTYAILLRDAGALPADVETQRMVALVDSFWYGPTQFESKRLWRLTHHWLCPDGFVLPNTYNPSAGVSFDTVEHLAGPTFQVEQQTGWPYHVVRFLFRFRAIPS